MAKALLESILAEITAKMQEPSYQHEGEDWVVGLIMAKDIIESYMEEQ